MFAFGGIAGYSISRLHAGRLIVVVLAMPSLETCGSNIYFKTENHSLYAPYDNLVVVLLHVNQKTILYRSEIHAIITYNS